MKKLIAVILILIMSISLVACGGTNSDAENDLVGKEWASTDGKYTIRFIQENICEFDSGFGEFGTYKYSYNAELEIVQVYMRNTVNFVLSEKDGTVCLECPDFTVLYENTTEN